ncbi:MAG: tetratricopeptide repeat protein, partial [Chloroflexi bacterium]|nr:tetratricopeptide repeat protein [Chloroflexota bacterium]
MNLTGTRFQPKDPPRRSNPWRVLAFLLLIAGGLWLARQVQQGAVARPFEPAPTATRTSHSYTSEGEQYFAGGKLEEAVAAYLSAVEVDPRNVDLRVELARIMVYSSSGLTTDAQRRDRLQQAREVIEQTISLNPDNSNAHAVHALALDWLSVFDAHEHDALLTQAGDAAVRALQINPANPLAQDFYAELLADQQKWTQALDIARQAVALAPDKMDVHRT